MCNVMQSCFRSILRGVPNRGYSFSGQYIDSRRLHLSRRCRAAGAGPPGWSAGFLRRTSALLLRRQASARADGYEPAELRLDSSCAGQPGPAFGQPRQAASGRLCPAKSSASTAAWSRTGVGLRVGGEALSRPVTPCGPSPPGALIPCRSSPALRRRAAAPAGCELHETFP